MNVLGEVGRIVLTTLLSVITLFLLAKLVGNRQMSQLSMFDYINGITIGSIAAELATDLENWHQSLTALILYGLITFTIDYLCDKSIKLRRIIEGHSIIIYDKGLLYEKNLTRSHMDVDEFLTLCRCQGYFDLQDIQTAIIEPNGKISILPKATKRPATPEDLGLNPTQDYPLASVIIDGKIIYGNLSSTGTNEIWLKKQLHANGVSDIETVMLATCSMDHKLSIYLKNGIVRKEDIFD